MSNNGGVAQSQPPTAKQYDAFVSRIAEQNNDGRKQMERYVKTIKDTYYRPEDEYGEPTRDGTLMVLPVQCGKLHRTLTLCLHA